MSGRSWRGNDYPLEEKGFGSCPYVGFHGLVDTDDDRAFWMAIRQALLMLLDALERKLMVNPRTSELRKMFRRDKIELPPQE